MSLHYSPGGSLQVVLPLGRQGPKDLEQAEVHDRHHFEPVPQFLGAVGLLCVWGCGVLVSSSLV